MKGIYLVTEEYGGRSHFDVALMALKSGVRIVQYREKFKSTRKMVEEARALKELTKKYGALFIVNDRVDVAVMAEADGVHVGEEDASVLDIRKYFSQNLIVGVSVSSVEEAVQAEQMGASYVAVSPVFDTATKPDAKRGLGLHVLRKVVESVRIQVVAIGGINLSNLNEVVDSGASAVAVVSAITRAENPEKAAKELVCAFEERWRLVKG